MKWSQLCVKPFMHRYVAYSKDADIVTIIPCHSTIMISSSLQTCQAGGSQVRLAAIEQGVVVRTDDTTRDCEILATQRISAGVQGLYTMQLALRQSVLASLTDLSILAPLIETGFNSIGDGGATFLNLLKFGNDFYDDLQDVSVLTAATFASNPPTRSPSFLTVMPSSFPPTTQVPSENNVYVTSGSPTEIPSSNPTTPMPHVTSGTPSLSESSSPTGQNDVGPSWRPSTLDSSHPSHNLSSTPTDEPSHNRIYAPSNRPATQVMRSETNDEIFTPLVISAIALGSLAGVVFCCFAIRFICCGCKSKKQRAPAAAKQGKTGAPPSNGKQKPFFPKVVQLNDDNRSLANTTLGEHTAGRKPPKKKRVVEINTSFDDSVYTSSSRILPAYHIHDATRSTSHVSRKPVSNPDRNIKSSPVRQGLVESPSLLGFSSLQASFFAGPDRSPSDTADSKSLDFATDFGDDLFFGDDEGMLGAMAPSSPVADRIEDMVTEELGGSYSDSEENSSTADNMIAGMDLDSPLDLLRLDASNVVVVGDRENTVGRAALSKDRRKIDFETIFGDDSDLASHSTRSSITEIIANKAPLRSNSIVSDDVNSDGSLLPERRKRPSETLSAFIRDKLAERKSTRSVGSGSSKEPPSPNAFQPTASDQHAVSASPAYRSRYLGALVEKETSSSDDDKAKDSPLPLPRGPSVADNRLGTAFLSGALLYPDTPTDPTPPSEDGAQTTPQASFHDGLQSPAVVRRSITSTNHPFRSPTPMTLIQSKIGRNEAPVSPSGQSSGSEEGNLFLFGAIERTLGPLSASADMESLGGRSGRSRDSSEGRKSARKRRLMRADNSIGSGNSGSTSHRRSFAISEEKSDAAIVSPRTLAHDIERLEKQLDVLRTEVTRTRAAAREMPSSTAIRANGGEDHSAASPQLRSARTKNRVVVTVPPGKLGIILANRRDGMGTVVAEVKNSSSLKGVLSAGDKLVAIDGVDVTGMLVSQIT